jgi:hypothetical protein
MGEIERSYYYYRDTICGDKKLGYRRKQYWFYETIYILLGILLHSMKAEGGENLDLEDCEIVYGMIEQRLLLDETDMSGMSKFVNRWRRGIVDWMVRCESEDRGCTT